MGGVGKTPQLQVDAPGIEPGPSPYVGNCVWQGPASRLSRESELRLCAVELLENVQLSLGGFQALMPEAALEGPRLGRNGSTVRPAFIRALA